MVSLALIAPRLVTDDQSGGAIPWGTVVLAALVVSIIGAAAVLYRRSRDRADHADRAVRKLARVLGLDERERSVLHTLSTASGIHAGALLVSGRAFEHAVDAAGRSPRPPKPAVVRALAVKVHPGDR